MNRSPVLICFAVKEEAQPFRAQPSDRWQILMTGMGKKNAAENFRKALAEFKPSLVISSGFAGGLNPKLKLGDVVFDEDAEAGLAPKLLKCGALPGRFHCADRIAVSAAEKEALWKSIGADAVEMESSVIRAICAEKKIPSATIRVISDTAKADLPLNFNELATPDLKMDFMKLAARLIRQPSKIPELMAFQKNISSAARKLRTTLLTVLAD